MKGVNVRGHWNHSFSTYAKYSEKLTFLTPLFCLIVAAKFGGNPVLLM